MDIKMFDVNFGEAIIYSEYGHNLLVDCGAKFYGKGKDAYNAIKNDFNFFGDEVLITHFDEDHYNGLIEMANDGKKIRKLYLPRYIVRNGSVNYTENYFIDQLRTIMYLHVLGSKNRLNMLQKLFLAITQITAPYYDIRTLAYGDAVYVGGTRLDIIWPDDNTSSIFTTLSDEVRSILIDRIRQSSEDNNERTVEEIIGEIDQAIYSYIGVFVDFYSVTNENEGEEINPYNEGRYSELGERFSAAHQALEEAERSVVIHRVDEISKITAPLFSSLIKCQNDCSIVFSKDTDILALGDASKRVVNYLKGKGRIDDYYEFLKAPHHGTVAYYSWSLPDAGTVFISNNGNKKLNWKISEEYPRRYRNKVYCTNYIPDRCEWIMQGEAPCTGCRIPKGYTYVRI